MNEKINEEINKIKELVKAWKELSIVIIFILFLVSLIGIRFYLYRVKEKKEIENFLDCHNQAVEKAQEKYRNEFINYPGCESCNQRENEGIYFEKDYELYYSECLTNSKVNK